MGAGPRGQGAVLGCRGGGCRGPWQRGLLPGIVPVGAAGAGPGFSDLRLLGNLYDSGGWKKASQRRGAMWREQQQGQPTLGYSSAWGVAKPRLLNKHTPPHLFPSRCSLWLCHAGGSPGLPSGGSPPTSHSEAPTSLSSPESRGPCPQKGTMRIESFWALVVKSWEAQPDCCVALGEFGTISELLSPSSPANLAHIS